MADGWVKLHRSIRSWEWWKDPVMAHAFIDILLLCNSTSYTWNGITMKAGSFVTSRAKLAKDLNLTQRQTRTVISRLVQTGEITVESNNHYSVLTVCKWSAYQVGDQKNDQQIDQQNDQPQHAKDKSLRSDFSEKTTSKSTNKTTDKSTNTDRNEKESTKEKVKTLEQEVVLNSSAPPSYDLFGESQEKPQETTCLTFDEFWRLYSKKVDRKACERVYARVSEKDRKLIKEHVPKYVQSTPDVQYRKNPLTYLHGACWNNEIVTQQSTESTGNVLHGYSFKPDESGTEKLYWE